MSVIYFSKEIEEIAELIESNKLIKKARQIGIKVHFGEKGCVTFISPDDVKKIYCAVKKANNNTKVNLVETNSLYRGARTNTEEHLKTAKEHGFDFAPIDILDSDGDYEIDGNKNFKKLKIGKNTENYDFFIIISHVKGHIMAGYGGALKNVAMGLASRKGKLDMHSRISPKINTKKCESCGKCISECPAGAIFFDRNNKAEIGSKCIGCAHCIAICPSKAIKIPWNSVNGRELGERIVDYSYGLIKFRKMIYINVLKNITKDCDCLDKEQKKEMEDIGYLFSEDVVAIEQASFDFVKKALNKLCLLDIQNQFDYAQNLGMGNKKYELKELV
ncbi:DUF362 domain-containing protein [Candidatus Pacearchaeota archaeon]|nr:DUF362 domain-containing protein [Candidatus Pacearchaeota archaeon]